MLVVKLSGCERCDEVRTQVTCSAKLSLVMAKNEHKSRAQYQLEVTEETWILRECEMTLVCLIVRIWSSNVIRLADVVLAPLFYCFSCD